MIKALLLFVLLFIAQKSLGQIDSIGSKNITITVLDSASMKLLYNSTIILRRNDSSIVGSFVADTSGMIILKNLLYSNYILCVSAVGYNIKKIPIIVNVSSTDNIHVRLEEKINNLQEVTVTGRTIENGFDKVIYTVPDQIIESAVSSFDVLTRAPLISLNSNNDLVLRGRGNIRFLLNGRQTNQNIIKALPATSIKKIEVITNPSAAYDAEGTAGVINVVTKKMRFDGIEGNVGGSIGTRNRNNASTYVSIKKQKLNVSFNYDVNTTTNKGYSNIYTGKLLADKYQESSKTNKQLYQYTGINMDYELDSMNSFGGVISIYNYLFNRNSNSTYYDIYTEKRLLDYSLVSNDKESKTGLNSSFDYTHLFKGKKKSFTLSYLYDYYNNNDVFSNTISNSTTINNKNNEYFLENTIQAKYKATISSKIKIDIGAKSIFRKNKSEYYYNDAVDRNGFDYAQNILASYINYNISMGKWNTQVGIRAELTDNKATFDNGYDTKSSILDFQYLNIFPNILIGKNLKEDKLIKISYSSRIQRPSIVLLNPYINKVDPRNITYGNPQLGSELNREIQLSYSIPKGNNYMEGSLYYNSIKNIITDIRLDIADTAVANTYINAGRNELMGIALYDSRQLSDRFSLNSSLSLEHSTIKSSTIKNNGINYVFSISSSWKMGKGFTMNATFTHTSPQVILQGTRTGSFFDTFNISKRFNNKKGSISFLVDDPLNIAGIFTDRINSFNFNQTIHSHYKLQSFKLKILYNFGKQNSTNPHSSSLSNGDLKSK